MFAAFVFVVATVHFAYLVYLLVGGLVALRWRRAIWPYLLAAVWATGSVLLHLDCPLTALEQWGRGHAGMLALPSTGYIAHYITGVLYPDGWATGVELVVFVIVTTSLVAFVATGRRHPAAIIAANHSV
ncbi:MAG: DUF2784 domain-containing protein [Actinomycetota bacterium]|nr:DUF2784 domain-containing protein [Actinomycetota bacterium]